MNLDLNYIHDIDGVKMVEYNGNYYYHPLNLAVDGIRYLWSFNLTGDSLFLRRAEIYSNKMLEIGIRENQAIYVPYLFNYRLHGGSTQEVILAPWYSSISQGNILAFYTRFYEITRNNYYKSIADSIYYSFLYTDTTSNTWISAVDSGGYLWFEEYPFNPRTMVLNGYLYAIFGLHYYYSISNDPYCLIVIKATLTTISNYANCYRNPGGISYYCLWHLSQLSEYHLQHIKQFRYLAQFTNDEFFSAFADSLELDYH